RLEARADRGRRVSGNGSRNLRCLRMRSTTSAFSMTAQGMQAAMPHLDLLAAGADLAAIERVLPQLIEALQ
ncbi:MAG: hypothetical protein L0Y45_08485, partial [Woeseiaceae bacterium]|nr:hypothetical protein [Woeseiaceae bacterium]